MNSHSLSRRWMILKPQGAVAGEHNILELLFHILQYIMYAVTSPSIISPLQNKQDSGHIGVVCEQFLSI